MKFNFFKNKNVLVIVIGCVCGLLLILLGNVSEKEKNEVTANENLYTSEELEGYTDALEKKVSSLISSIGGVSDVNVLVTVEISKEKVYATTGDNKDYVIITDASGNESALTVAEINANVRGIAVVCNYGGNEALKMEIINMLASLFNIGSNRISVMSA